MSESSCPERTSTTTAGVQDGEEVSRQSLVLIRTSFSSETRSHPSLVLIRASFSSEPRSHPSLVLIRASFSSEHCSHPSLVLIWASFSPCTCSENLPRKYYLIPNWKLWTYNVLSLSQNCQESLGAIQVFRKVFFCKLNTPFIMPICADPYTPTLRYVTLEWPLFELLCVYNN